MTGHSWFSLSEQSESKVPSHKREEETEDKEKNMCEYEKGREKLTPFLIFIPRGNSLLISLCFYTVSFFLLPLLYWNVLFFTTIIMNIDRYGRSGISDGDCISSLCVFLLVY